VNLAGRMDLGELSAFPTSWSSARTSRVPARCHLAGWLAGWRRRAGQVLRLRVAAVVRCWRRAIPQLDFLDRANRIAGHETVRGSGASCRCMTGEGAWRGHPDVRVMPVAALEPNICPEAAGRSLPSARTTPALIDGGL
jgi:hypothetical protein